MIVYFCPVCDKKVSIAYSGGKWPVVSVCPHCGYVAHLSDSEEER